MDGGSEKQREAYVEFLGATRSAYQSISLRDQERARLKALGTLDKQMKAFEGTRAAEIDSRIVEVKHAQAVLDIVGPPEMAVLGRQVGARLRLDRWLTSSRLEHQLTNEKDDLLRQAEETGNIELLTSLRAALVPGPAN